MSRQAPFMRAFNRALDDPRWWFDDPDCGRLFAFTRWLDSRGACPTRGCGWRHRTGSRRR